MRKRRKLRIAAVLLATLMAVWLLASYLVADRLTRRRHPIAPEPIRTLSWGTMEEHRLTTSDGQQLGAWFVVGRDDQPVVLLLHGNGGNRGNCLNAARLFGERGCPVLMITLRGHGDSTGERNDFGYSARHDVVAAVDWLSTHQPSRPIVVWGQSLGAAAALFAAEELDRRVHGYILECPYQDIYTAVRNRTQLYLPPLLDQLAYAGLMTVAPLTLPDADRISPMNAAAQMPRALPVLILAGSADRRARPEEARQIHARLGPEAKLLVIEGADHVHLDKAEPEKYRQALEDFVDQVHQEQRSLGAARRKPAG